jgi:alpha-1,3-rhamnosyl/mannosyltransferase
MHVGLNLLHALPEIGGGWNYIANLVGALGECDDANTYIAFVNTESECLVPNNPKFVSVRVNIRPGSRPQRVIFENTMLQPLAHKYKLDCMHWFANTQALINAVPGVVTVYDLQPFLHLATFSLTKRSYLRFMMYLTCKRASMLLPMSQATARGLQNRLNVDPDRMVVIPAILPYQFAPGPPEKIAGIKTKYGLPERFWLYVAHLYPHKNHLRLLEAYHELLSSRFSPWPLVLRGDPHGAEKEVMQAIARFNLEKNVIILPRLDEKELTALYAAATALVFPSLYEGGGIPVLEAMACGCPVVAANIPPVREFAGDAASYFDPTDTNAIGKAMAAFQDTSSNWENKRQVGLARTAEFRPRPVVNKLLKAYARAASR